MSLPADQEVCLMWLRSHIFSSGYPIDFYFTNTDIETVLPDWGVRVLATLHTPGTYSRAFRRLRERGAIPVTCGAYAGSISIAGIKHPTSRVKRFRASFTLEAPS